MSCKNCNCSSCRPSSLGVRELTDAEIQSAIDKVWSDNSTCVSMTRPAMMGMVMRVLGTKPVEYKAHDERITNYIMNHYKVVKGRMGGIMNPAAMIAHKARMSAYKDGLLAGARITDMDIKVCLDGLKKLPAINNHICPHCKNDRVSKSEASCWKCGGNLH